MNSNYFRDLLILAVSFLVMAPVMGQLIIDDFSVATPGSVNNQANQAPLPPQNLMIGGQTATRTLSVLGDPGSVMVQANISSGTLQYGAEPASMGNQGDDSYTNFDVDISGTPILKVDFASIIGQGNLAFFATSTSQQDPLSGGFALLPFQGGSGTSSTFDLRDIQGFDPSFLLHLTSLDIVLTGTAGSADSPDLLAANVSKISFVSAESLQAVPEPASIWFALIVLLVLGFSLWQKTCRQASAPWIFPGWAGRP